jgi:hypothetical protein
MYQSNLIKLFWKYLYIDSICYFYHNLLQIKGNDLRLKLHF